MCLIRPERSKRIICDGVDGLNEALNAEHDMRDLAMYDGGVRRRARRCKTEKDVPLPRCNRLVRASTSSVVVGDYGNGYRGRVALVDFELKSGTEVNR